MNLLYISSKKRWGGVSSWMQKTALGLEGRGHKVWILAHPEGRFAAAASSDVKVVLKKLGMDYNPVMIWWLVQFIKTHGIDLVVTNIEKEVAIGGIAARLSGIPNIRRVGREDDFNRRLKVRWNHQTLVDHCIVPCDYVRDRAIERAPWLRMEQFKTIYNGRNIVDNDPSEVEALRRSWGGATGRLVVGITAQLSRQKRIDLLIRAFSRVLKRLPGLVLVVTGEGPERSSLENLVTELGLAHAVVFAGFSHLPEFVSAAYDIAVSSSSIEGFPNTVVEYFAVGRPVVTTRAGGVCEMARNGHNALVVDVDDEAALAEAIHTLAVNPDYRRTLGENAMQTIRSGFSEDLMLEGLCDYIEGIHNGIHQPVGN